MATQAKTSGTSEVTMGGALETALAEALGLLEAGRLPEARGAFEALLGRAAEAEALGMCRSLRCYLAAVDRRIAEQAPVAGGEASLEALLHLNGRDAAGALAILDGAPAGDSAGHHYLRALALARLERVQEAAEALTEAVRRDGDLLFQYRLEPDFDAVRATAPFAALERA